VTRMGFAMFFPPMHSPKSKVRFVECERPPAESLSSQGVTLILFAKPGVSCRLREHAGDHAVDDVVGHPRRSTEETPPQRLGSPHWALI
jgi:hypothetical protein